MSRITVILFCAIAAASAELRSGYSSNSESGLRYVFNAPADTYSNPPANGNAGGNYPSPRTQTADPNFGPQLGAAPTQTVTKDVYVHVAPPEPEAARAPQVIGGGQSQKHYKIVFIKAPSYQPAPAPVIAPQAQYQEKTIVYVLVKKPEEQGDIVVPTAAPVQPSKPEVYFIRYKAQKQQTSGPGTSYGAPQQPQTNYGAPSSQYGAPL